MLATPDGGRTWTPITQLAACLTQCGAGAEQVTDIRFASPAIGYLYDSFASSPLLLTTDGGHRWSVEPGRATVALDVSGGQATRVSASGTGCPGPCRWSIDEAALGSNAWNTVDVPATTNHVSAQLARQGSASYTLFPGNLASGAGSQQADLYISQAGGAQWSHQSDPCGSPGSDPDDAQAIAAAPDRVLAVLCAPRHGGPGFLIVATDAGASYGNREKVPLAGGSQLAASSPTSLLVGNAGELGPSLYRYRFRLFHSNGGGRPWRAVVDQDSGVSQVIPESWDSRPSPTAGGSPPPAPFGLPPTPEPAGPDRDFSGRPRPVSSLPAPG